MKTILITGANRGIGLEFVRQYLSEGNRVLATCRNPEAAEDLKTLASSGSLEIGALDVCSQESVDALAERWQNERIDLLINNAGVYGPRTGFGPTNYEAWEEVLRTNTLAPFRVALAFVDRMNHGGTLAFVTSKMGSITDNTSGGAYVYRSSKAALNMIVKSMSIDLAPRGLTCVLLHPGWVKTDMGGPNALIDTLTSVSGMRSTLAEVGPNEAGAFFNYNGDRIPW
ncbi:SDR family oxidoreductase [Sulfidibacter corallicola]|uniref:SDR family oxidoreductase n=1 Tax=Sulfidibacter corallicola TaxID=2818388 RepID=A0A8A4TDQ1_SULCO|nr:SDR family oxidoreductase [Sulfidibacter corallicola]QTD48056.1 SDR family oxidoreductase [Sulfidibacter corallicola]